MAQDPARDQLIPIGAVLTGPHWPGPVRVVRVEPRGSSRVLVKAVTLDERSPPRRKEREGLLVRGVLGAFAVREGGATLPLTYTNHKGTTYILCRGTTKRGKPRYYLAREPKGEPLDEIPDRYEIRESVNGIVSLARIRPQKILPEEVATVKAALARHPESHNYRMEVKGKQIVIYERIGLDAQDILSALGSLGEMLAHRTDALQESLDQRARFSPEMRFTLEDEETREFGAERWCYRGRIDGWLELTCSAPINDLARELIQTLGTDAFFELY